MNIHEVTVNIVSQDRKKLITRRFVVASVRPATAIQRAIRHILVAPNTELTIHTRVLETGMTWDEFRNAGKLDEWQKQP